jgi:pyrimidine operon attenuation protein/uracil phosphoribosyltransferase
MKTEILNSNHINQKIERIAYQIYEDTFEEPEIFIAGIKGNGMEFAKRLHEQLRDISTGDYLNGIHLFEITVHKSNPLNHTIDISITAEQLKNVTVILADDVINSGSTLLHATSSILQQQVKTIKTAVLVNRTHRRFPISANYVGLDITTTLQDKIVVEFDEKNAQKDLAYLV